MSFLLVKTWLVLLVLDIDSVEVNDKVRTPPSHVTWSFSVGGHPSHRKCRRTRRIDADADADADGFCNPTIKSSPSLSTYSNLKPRPRKTADQVRV